MKINIGDREKIIQNMPQCYKAFVLAFKEMELPDFLKSEMDSFIANMYSLIEFTKVMCDNELHANIHLHLNRTYVNFSRKCGLEEGDIESFNIHLNRERLEDIAKQICSSDIDTIKNYFSTLSFVDITAEKCFQDTSLLMIYYTIIFYLATHELGHAILDHSDNNRNHVKEYSADLISAYILTHAFAHWKEFWNDMFLSNMGEQISVWKEKGIWSDTFVSEWAELISTMLVIFAIAYVMADAVLSSVEGESATHPHPDKRFFAMMIVITQEYVEDCELKNKIMLESKKVFQIMNPDISGSEIDNLVEKLLNEINDDVLKELCKFHNWTKSEKYKGKLDDLRRKLSGE